MNALPPAADSTGPARDAQPSALIAYVERELVVHSRALARRDVMRMQNAAEISRLAMILGCARERIEAMEEAARPLSTREREAATWSGRMRRLLRIVREEPAE